MATTAHGNYLRTLGTDALQSKSSTELAQMATDFCGYFISPDTARKIKNRVLDSGGIIKEERTLTQEANMRDATQSEQSRIERLLKDNGYRPQWGIAWAHLEDNGVKTTVLLKNPAQIKEEEDRHAVMIADLRAHAPKYPPIKYKKVTDGHLMNIDVADLHIGKLALSAQTGADYNCDIAVKSAHDAVTELLRRAQGYPIERFLFPIGNDILHVDGSSNTTTKGTKQDVDGMSWMHFRLAKRMYVEMVERLLKIAPVHIMYNGSNHDENSGYHLAEALESHFYRSKNVTFDIDPKDRKYYAYGRCLIGGTHGHTAKAKDLPLLMATEAPRLWADSQYRYMHIHHIHHWSKIEFQTGKDYPGVTVQSMRSLSAPDVWHAAMGYLGAPRAVDAFLYHPEYGQVNHLSAVFNK